MNVFAAFTALKDVAGHSVHPHEPAADLGTGDIVVGEPEAPNAMLAHSERFLNHPDASRPLRRSPEPHPRKGLYLLILNSMSA